jgi:type IV fimbrial biogenesis protein FimT
MRHAADPAAGTTLWELLATLAVLAVLLASALPGLQAWRLDARRGAAVSAFLGAVQLARSEAAKRGRPAILCPSTDGAGCATNGAPYESGWIVFINEDDERPPTRSPAEPLLLTHIPAMAGTIRSNRAVYEFRPFTWRSTNGTVTFCDARGAAQARAVIVSYTGRPRVSARGPGNRRLQCA